MHRLFVALRPPPTVRDLLADTMDGVDGARWQDDEQLHLTVRYIGEVDARVADDLAASLESIAAPAPTVSVRGVGRFAVRGRTDTLWAGFPPTAALAALHRKVDRACVAVGLAPERRAYLPHVTLARLPRAGHDAGQVDRWQVRHGGLHSAAFALSHLILYESRLGAEGARYDAVLRWPLGTSGSVNGSHP